MAFIVGVTVLCAIRAALTPINGDPLHAFVSDQQVIDAHLRQSEIFGDDAGKMLIVVADDGNKGPMARTVHIRRGNHG